MKSTASVATLGESLSGHDNAFGFLRLLLAFLVVVDHASQLGGFGESTFNGWVNRQASLGSLAVDGFFAISGFLIAKSALSNDWLQFLWRRALRLFPGFWGVLGVTAFVVGPAVWLSTQRPIASYFAPATETPVGYFLSNLSLRIYKWGFLDLFRDTPFGREIKGSSVNGSLWTLIFEWRCYLYLLAMSIGGVLARAKVLVPLIGVVLIGIASLARGDPQITTDLLGFAGDGARFTGIFLFGSAAALYAGRLPFDDRLGWFSFFVVFATLVLGGFRTLGTPAYVYLMLWLAVRLPRPLRAIGAANDYSYGVYLYSFLVEQCLAEAFVYRWGFFVFLSISAVLSLACAFLSWHCIEKPALRLKDRGPGRGVAALLSSFRAAH